MAKEPTNLTVESAVKREARLAAGRRLISLSEYTEIAWAAAIEAEKSSVREEYNKQHREDYVS